jgi:hypothetical protein
LNASLLEMAYQLAALAAAVAPDQREAWAQGLRPFLQSGLDSPLLAQEAALTGVALAWVASSSYITDALFTPAATQGVDCLVLLQGFEAEPIERAGDTFWRTLAATPSMSRRHEGRWCCMQLATWRTKHSRPPAVSWNTCRLVVRPWRWWLWTGL